MENNEQIEKSANVSLDDFMGDQAVQTPSIEVPQAPAQSVSAPAPAPAQAPVENQPIAQQVEAPVSAPAPDVSNNEPTLVDPSLISIGTANDGDGTKNKLDEDDVEEVQYGDKTLKVSKKTYTIKSVSKQEEYAIKKISSGDFTMSRDNKSKWVQTRLEIVYTEGTYKTSLPNLKFFEDKYKPNHYAPSFKRISTEKDYQNPFTSAVSKLYFKFCQQFKKSAGEFGQEEFFKSLIGKKVQLTETEQEFDGKTFRRLDVFKFV